MSSRGVLTTLYCSAPGAVTSKAGEEAWLPSPWLKILWESWEMSTWCAKGSGCLLSCVCCPSPAAGGFAPLL
jgi:hypothetical protein